MSKEECDAHAKDPGGFSLAGFLFAKRQAWNCRLPVRESFSGWRKGLGIGLVSWPVVGLFGLPVHVHRQDPLQRQQDIGARLPEVDGLDVAVAFLAGVEPVQTLAVGAVGQRLVLLSSAVGALYALEQPLHAATRADQPSGSLLLFQEGEIRRAGAYGAGLAPPQLLGHQLRQSLGVSRQERR